MYTSIIHPNKFALHKNKYSSYFYNKHIDIEYFILFVGKECIDIDNRFIY